MSRPAEPKPVKLIAGLISARERLISEAVEVLARRFGEIDYISRLLDFSYTDYYEKEMGSELKRRFVSFRDLIDPGTLPEIKLAANAVEEGFAENGKRKVNIDPGYLTPFHLILATGKGYAHRPYLRKGIYADLTLIYRDKAFRSLEWTYPDYAGDEIKAVLGKIRRRYIQQLKPAKTEK